MASLTDVFSDRLSFLIAIDSLPDLKLIAERSGVSYHCLIDYTLGRRVAQASNLVKLASYFDCSVDYLLGLSPAPESISRHSLFL